MFVRRYKIFLKQLIDRDVLILVGSNLVFSENNRFDARTIHLHTSDTICSLNLHKVIAGITCDGIDTVIPRRHAEQRENDHMFTLPGFIHTGLV